MRRLFETVLALVFAVVFTHSACAGSAVVTPNWTGFYIGANAGYGWGDPDSFLRWQRASDDRFSAPLTPGHYVTKPSGGIVGIQGGYNHQINAFVLGIEADFQIADISGSTRTPSTFLPIANDLSLIHI